VLLGSCGVWLSHQTREEIPRFSRQDLHQLLGGHQQSSVGWVVSHLPCAGAHPALPAGFSLACCLKPRSKCFHLVDRGCLNWPEQPQRLRTDRCRVILKAVPCLLHRLASFDRCHPVRARLVDAAPAWPGGSDNQPSPNALSLRDPLQIASAESDGASAPMLNPGSSPILANPCPAAPAVLGLCLANSPPVDTSVSIWLICCSTPTCASAREPVWVLPRLRSLGVFVSRVLGAARKASPAPMGHGLMP